MFGFQLSNIGQILSVEAKIVCASISDDSMCSVFHDSTRVDFQLLQATLIQLMDRISLKNLMWISMFGVPDV